MAHVKKLKYFTATTPESLESAINAFFEDEGMCWRAVSVVQENCGYWTAWLEYDPS